MQEERYIPEKLATLTEQNKWIMAEMKELRHDVKSLKKFEGKLVGIGLALGAGGSVLMELIKAMVLK